MVENVEVITRPKVSAWIMALFAVYNYSYSYQNFTEILKLSLVYLNGMETLLIFLYFDLFFDSVGSLAYFVHPFTF